MRYATIKAISQQMFKEATLLSDKDSTVRRFTAGSIIAMFNDLQEAGKVDVAEYLMLKQLKDVVRDAVVEIEQQNWQDYTDGFDVAQEYVN